MFSVFIVSHSGFSDYLDNVFILPKYTENVKKVLNHINIGYVGSVFEGVSQIENTNIQPVPLTTKDEFLTHFRHNKYFEMFAKKHPDMLQSFYTDVYGEPSQEERARQNLLQTIITQNTGNSAVKLYLASSTEEQIRLELSTNLLHIINKSVFNGRAKTNGSDVSIKDLKALSLEID